MNWYKRVYSGNERKFTVRDILHRFKAYNVVRIHDRSSGSHNVFKNLNNGQFSNFCYHNEGADVLKPKLTRTLGSLGIDYNEFITFKKPRKQITEQPIEQSIEESWKKDKWYQDYLKSIKTDDSFKMKPKHELV